MKLFNNRAEACFYYFFTVIEAVVNTYFAYILSGLINLAHTGTLKSVLQFTVFGLGYVVILLVMSYLCKSYYNKLVYRYMSSFKDAVYASALKERYSEGIPSGEYINVLTNDAMQVEMLYIDSCLTAPRQVFGFLSGTIAAVLIHPLLFVLIFVFGTVSALFMRKRSEAMMQASETLSRSNEAYAKVLKTQLDSNILLRMEDLTGTSRTIVSNAADKALYAHFMQKQTLNITMISVMSLGLFSTLIVMAAAALLALYGLVSVGGVIASGHLIGCITTPIGEIGRIYTNYKAGKLLKNKIRTQFICSDSANVCNNADTVSPAHPIENIEVSDLQFSIGEKSILKGITMTFTRGKKYVIVGKAGAGKSTLLKLIAGIFDARTHITYNGKQLSQHDIFNAVCYIPQHIIILEDTLHNNIILNEKDRYTDQADTPEAHCRSTSIASAAETLIEKLGLAVLAEKRKTGAYMIDEAISGGEKQKIAMARALFKDRSVFLFDEFNAGLDNYSMKQIEALVTEQTDKLVIFITHRLNAETLKKCDEVIYMQDGRIIEHGSFTALLANEHSAFKHFYESGSVSE